MAQTSGKAQSRGATPSTQSAKPTAKSSGKPAPPNAIVRFGRWLGRYFTDVRAEMRRVVWPSRDEIVNSSWIVVITLAIFIVLIGSLDYVASWAVNLLAGLGG
jgi:preprotein translocase subunit SecE